jgi:hypothetical protein
MEVFFRPFTRLWFWIEQEGGYPGQLFAVCVVVMGILGICAWFGNRR